MKKANEKEQTLIGKVYSYVFENSCSNDYHLEKDLEDKILDATPINKKYGDVLIDMAKETISLVKKLSKEASREEDLESFDQEVKKGEKIISEIQSLMDVK